MSGAVACPLCPGRFGSAVALDFHVRQDHGEGGAARARPAILAAYRFRDRRRAEAREAAATKTLDRLYSKGCPCGRSLAQHRAARAAAGGVS